jgi:hypothetical protein
VNDARLIVILMMVLLCAVVSCESVPRPVVCRSIPTGGCPKNAEACSDPTCDAVYACEPDGTWSLDHRCPERGGSDAAVDVASPPQDVAASDPHDASPYADVAGAGGGAGCVDLEPPDCPLATVVACPADQCCGCEDLFVCRNGGWDPWGTCDPATGTISSP